MFIINWFWDILAQLGELVLLGSYHAEVVADPIQVCCTRMPKSSSLVSTMPGRRCVYLLAEVTDVVR